MADKKLNIKVSTKGANKAKRELGGVAGGLKSLGKQAIIAGGAFFAAQGILNGFKTAIRLAGEQEKVERKLATALGHVNKELLAQASAFQKQSQFGDEVIIGMMALAFNMGIAEDKLSETTKMAIGLSEALNVDLNMAMKAAAGAIQGDTNMLTRYIPILKTTTDETDKLNIVQEVANKGFKQSQENVDTLSGQLNQMSMAWGDAGEDIGEIFAPAVIKLAHAFESIAEGVKSFIAFSGDTIMTLAGIEKATDQSKESTKDFAIAQTILKEETILANIELTSQQVLLQTGLESVADSLTKRLALLEQDQAALGNQSEAVSEVNKLFIQLGIELHEVSEHEIGLMQNIINTTNAIENSKKITENSFESFELAQLDKLSMMEHEKDMVDEFILKYPDMADALGMVTEEHIKQIPIIDKHVLALERLAMISAGMIVEDKKLTEGQQDFIKVTGDLGTMMTNTSNLLAATAGDDIKRQIQAMKIAQFAAIANTAKEATKVLANPIALFGVLAAGAAQLITIQSAIENAQSAEFGFEGVVNKPTLFMTGEGGKAEHVSVTPLQSPNINGPQGGITLNIQGNMIGNEEFVRDVLVVELAKAQRMNLA